MFVVDERGDTFEVLFSGTFREVDEQMPMGVVRDATSREVEEFKRRRVDAWVFVTEKTPYAKKCLVSAGLPSPQMMSDVGVPALCKAWRVFDSSRGSWRGLVRRIIWCDILKFRSLRDPYIQMDLPEQGERNVPDVKYILEKLPEDQRLILILRFWEGMKLEEIAKVMGFVKSGAWLRVKRALERAREVVDNERDV